MRFLADESCDFGVVRTLRDAGYDVVAIVEVSPRAEDLEVIDRCIHEERLLLTEDKDFGQLFFAHQKGSEGVILLRYPAKVRKALSQDVLRLVELYGSRLKGCFVVMQPGRIRMSRRAKREA